MRAIKRWAVLMAALSATGAAAQKWERYIDPTENWAGAQFVRTPTNFLTMGCLNPAFDPAAYLEATGDHVGPAISGPGLWLLTLPDQAFPEAARMLDAPAEGGATPQVALSVDGRARLRAAVSFNLELSTFELEIPFDHPLEEALKAGARLTARHLGSGETSAYALRGSRAALSAARAICERR